MGQKRIIIPLPSYGFDPTEVAIPWKILTENGIEVVFTTPKGQKASTDSIMLHGTKLGIWSTVLRARQDAVDAYHLLEQNDLFCNPEPYLSIKEIDFEGIFLPGGHDKGVKEYLESTVLQNLIVTFFNSNKPVSAICHGVLLVARSINPNTRKSVLHNYKTTSLLKTQELMAFNMTRLWLKDYYLTYPGITVEEEVKEVLANVNNFINGPSPMFRDSIKNIKRGFIVKDRNYLSARWPGDVYKLSFTFVDMVNE